MIEVETSTTPPEDDTEDGDGESTHISVSIHGTRYRSASAIVDGDDTTEIVDALVEAIRGVAAMCGSDLQVALARRLM